MQLSLEKLNFPKVFSICLVNIHNLENSLKQLSNSPQNQNLFGFHGSNLFN